MAAVEIGGCVYRSRVEALWSLYLSGLGYSIEHEPFWIHSRKSASYLPDFWLPGWAGGTVVEVKFGRVVDRDLAKWRAALEAFEGRVRFLVLDGPPPGNWHLTPKIPSDIAGDVASCLWRYGGPADLELDWDVLREGEAVVNAAAAYLQPIKGRGAPEWNEWWKDQC